MQENTAYDLNAARAQQEPQAQMRVRPGGGNRKLKRRLSALRSTAVVVVLLGLVWGMLYSQASLTEVGKDIQKTQKELVAARSEYDYLSSVLDNKTSVQNVEEIARTQLGLVKLDKSQIIYTALEEESVITVPDSGFGRLIEEIKGGLLSLGDYLDP